MSRRWVDLATAEFSAILGFLGAVEGEAWDRSTVCAGWSVKDVLSHLTNFEVRAGRLYRGETDGADMPASPEESEAGVRLWNVLPGDAVRAAYWQHGTASRRIAERFTDDEWRRPVKAAPATELRHFARIHFFETAVHGHDITSALFAPPLWGDRAPALVELCVKAAPAALEGAAIAPAGSLAVEVESAGRWILASGTDGWKVVPDADADAALSTDAETLVLATTGRIDVVEAFTRSDVSGDRASAERILAGWRIV